MQTAVGKPPSKSSQTKTSQSKKTHLRKARRRDSLAEARMRLADETVRDPRKERQAMLRFLAYLKPYIPLFSVATLCGITNYAIGCGRSQRRRLHVWTWSGHATRHAGRVNPAVPRAGPPARASSRPRRP